MYDTMSKSTLKNPFGWSWSGLALGPIALARNGLWREFFGSLGTLITVMAVSAVASLLPALPLQVSMLPLVLLTALLVFHVLVGSSLNRWIAHAALEHRRTLKSDTLQNTLVHDMALLRQRAEFDRPRPNPYLRTAPRLKTASAHAGSDAYYAVVDDPLGDRLSAAPDYLFAQALDELRSTDSSSPARDDALWRYAKLVHQGNDDLARSFYIRLRVANLVERDPTVSPTVPAAISLKRANSRRMARLRAYASFIETACEQSSLSTQGERAELLLSIPSRIPAVDTAKSISQLNTSLRKVGLTVTATVKGGYLVRGLNAESLEIGDQHELEQFLQLLLQTLAVKT